jgi:hypothetical protein
MVEVITNPRQVNLPDTSEAGVDSSRAYLGLRRNQIESASNFFANGVGRFWTVLLPPLVGFRDLTSRPVYNANRKSSGQWELT